MPLSRDIPSSSKGNRGMSSSYPPTNPRSRETLYRTQGWERNTFGDFPPDPMASIMCLPSTSGYNATRSMRFPDETTMGRQYDNYKEISDTAAAASTQYKRERRELGTHMSKISREGHGQLSARSESIVDHRKDEAHARDEFLRRHLGRRDHEFYSGHKQQVRDQGRAAENMRRNLEEHQERR